MSQAPPFQNAAGSVSPMPQPPPQHVQMNVGQGQPVPNAQKPQGKVLGFAETPLPNKPPSREHSPQRTPSFELGVEPTDDTMSYEQRPGGEPMPNIMRSYYPPEPEYHRLQPLGGAQSYSDISAASIRFSSNSYEAPKTYRDSREMGGDAREEVRVAPVESRPPKVLIIKRQCQHDDSPIPTTVFVFVVFVLNVVFLCSLTYRFFQEGHKYRHY